MRRNGWSGERGRHDVNVNVNFTQKRCGRDERCTMIIIIDAAVPSSFGRVYVYVCVCVFVRARGITS